MTATHRNEEPEELLNRAVAATRQLSLSDGPSDELKSKTLAALDDALSHPKANLFQEVLPMPWTSKTIAVLATAASLLVVYLGLHNLTGGGTLAFADVVQVLNNVRSATWKTSSELKLPQNVTVKSSGTGMFLAPAHERMEFVFQGSEGIQILDGEKGKILTLDPASKKAVIIDVKNLPPGQDSPFGKTFQSWRDLAILAQKGEFGKVEGLGTKTIDGRLAEGFRIQRDTLELKIWVDSKTSLPVRVETTTTSGPEGHTVLSDFQVDMDLDKELFSLELPTGYTLQQTAQIDLSKDPIYYLAETLRLTAEVNDGVFPPTLRGDDGIDGILMRSPLKLAKAMGASTDSPQQSRDVGIKLSMNIGATFGFLGAISAEQNDWHYAGKGVKLNAPNQPIFWLRRHKASETYQVLYADLSVNEVSRENVPKAPAPNPQPGP
jgi:outer membrane lipoprotein-sorting protein